MPMLRFASKGWLWGEGPHFRGVELGETYGAALMLPHSYKINYYTFIIPLATSGQHLPNPKEYFLVVHHFP